MKRTLSLLALVALVIAPVTGQTPVTIDSGDQVGYAGACNKHVVRDSVGVLYMIRIDSNVAGTRTLVLGASFDGGNTWGDIISSGINGPSSGESGSALVGSVSMAIDDQDILHVCWLVSQSNAYYNQFYRSIDPGTLMLGTLVDFKAANGISNSVKSSANAIVVDAANYVWIQVSSSSSWRAQLMQSDAPYAATGTFTSRGQLSVSASAQNGRMCVDAAGLIHTTYYENTGSGDHRHRAYDPNTGTWSVATDIGDLAPVNDYTSALCSDFLGNTHMICNQNSYAPTGNPTVVYYKRDSSGTFSAPITVTAATNSQYASVGNQHTMDIACNEVTGDVYVMFRDFSNGGSLEIAFLPNGGTSFVPFSTVRVANGGQHYYYIPRIRGSLYPANNNTGTDVHVTWREMWPAPFDFKFLAITAGMPPMPKYAGNGTAAYMSVTVNGSVSSPVVNEHMISSPTDQLTLSYDSVGDQLDGAYFLSTVQIFQTGSVTSGILLPGDAMGPLIIDLGSPIAAIVSSLGGVGTFNPVIGSTTFGFTFGPSLFGANNSVITTLICLDPANVSNPAGYGNAEAHEFILN